MKRFRTFFALAALLAGALASCTDDLGKAAVESRVRSRGVHLETSLAVVPMDDPSATKSTFAGDVAAVAEWTLLQFDAADGRLAAKYHMASGADITNVEVVAGHPYHWFAVANCGDVRGQFALGTATAAAMESWVASGLDMASCQSKGALPMAWSSLAGAPSGIAFTKEQLQQGARLGVALRRLVAKYDVSVVRSGLSKYSFVVEEARLVGPTAVRPFGTNRASSVVAGADVATTSGSASDVARMNGGAAVTFYGLENMYGEKAVSDPWQKKPKNIGVDDRPTYVEIMGKAAGGGLTDIAVTYRFFLGTNATSNFDVIRNTANSVTLTLSDAAIDAALQESASSTPPSDPIWKIEAGGYTDGRVLQFADGVAAGGSGLQVTSGTYTAEGVQRTPSDLSYRFKLDAALYAAGMRVFYDAAGASELPSGYGSGWVDLAGSPAQLYFHLPSGSPSCTGQAHVTTADGRKYDDLDIRAGRSLDHLELEFGAVNGTSWSGVRYAADVDTIFIETKNYEASGFRNRFAVRVFAVYSDGSEVRLVESGGEDASLPSGWAVSYGPLANAAPGVVAGYVRSSPSAFFSNLTPWAAEYRAMELNHTGNQSMTFTFTDEGTSKSITFGCTVLVGQMSAFPASNNAVENRLRIPLGESVDISYSWVANNGRDSVDILNFIKNDISMFSGGGAVTYEGVVGGKARFNGVAIVESAGAFVAGRQWFRTSDIVSALGLDPAKCRVAGIGTPGDTQYRTWNYSYFTVYDARVLDHLEITPSKVFCPGVSMGSGEQRNYKLYAHFTDGSVDDITVDPSVVWNRPSGNYVNDAYGYGVRFGTSADGQVVVMKGSSPFTNNGEYKRITLSRITATQYEMLLTYGTWAWVTANNPVTFFSADYTFGGVTKSAVVQATVDDTRQPQVLTIAPATQDAYVGGRPVALTATVTYDDGTTADVTATAAWADDAAGLLANNGGGSYTTGSTSGTTTVTASYTANGVTVTGNIATVNVLDRTAVAVQLQVRPDGAADWTTSNQVVTLGTYQSWRLRVDYADGGEPDYLDAGFTVSSTVPAVLSVGSGGTVTFAEAVGTSSVSTTFAGLASNSIAVEVRDHDYTYELIVSTAGAASSTTLEFVRSCAADVTLGWNGSTGFNAYLVRYDNGILDPSFGTGVLAGKPFRDVSATAAWSITSELTLANVGTWTESSRVYVAENRSGGVVVGTVTAAYSDGGINASDDIGLRVRNRVTPRLSGSPLSLEWEWHQSGSGSAKTVSVTAVACSWSVKSVSSGFGYSVSSSSVSVWPLSQNTSSSNLTGTLVLEGTDGVADVVVDLTQYNWTEGPGGIQRRIVSVYIAKAGTTTKITSDVIDAGGSETYNLVCHSQYRVGSGAWNDEYDVVAGTSLSWNTSPSGHHSLSMSGTYDSANARVTNTNASGSDQTITLGANPSGNWSGDHIWLPVTYAYGLTHGSYGASATITLRAGAPPTVYRIVTGVSPASVAWDGTASASATLQSSSNGGGSWSTVRSVTSSVSFTADDACVSVSGSTLRANNTSSSDKSVGIAAGGYTGSETIAEYVPATLTVRGQAPELSASPTSLEWEWNQSGSGSGKTVSVTAVNCSWSVGSISSGFDHSVSGNTVRVWPTSQNTASGDVTGTLVIQGTNGVSGVTVSLRQTGKPAPTLEYITVGDARATSWAPVNSVAYGDNISMTCTAHYSDGTTEDVTSAASWGTATNVGHTGNVYTCTSNGVSPSGEGSSITVSYGGKSTSFTLTLYPKYVVSMNCGFGSSYSLSADAKPTGRVTYNDGSTATLQAGQLDGYEVYENGASQPVLRCDAGDEVSMSNLGTGSFNITIRYTSKRYGSDNTVTAGASFTVTPN